VWITVSHDPPSNATVAEHRPRGRSYALRIAVTADLRAAERSIADWVRTACHKRPSCPPNRDCRGTYGRRRVRAALLADYDMNVNLKLVNTIMSENGLYGLPRPGRRLPNLIRVATPADLVNRQFTATRPNELWRTDITEHPARDGKVYCCAILDCFSRMIVARTCSTTPDTALVNNAVNMVVANRNRRGTTILHSDHGTPNSRRGASARNVRR
jgi:transposase InsO family protein